MDFPITLAAGSAVQERRSVYKSPNTTPLQEGFCNVPLNTLETVREIIDQLKGDLSRNMFLTKVLVQGIAAEFPEAADKIAEQLRQAGRLMCFAFCLFTVVTADELRRPSRSSRRDEVSQSQGEAA